MQIGPYTVQAEIARGGHGVVYRAQDAQGQVVALKVLLAHRAHSEAARMRFQAEVNALVRLRHPHVVSILSAGKHGGSPWLALDYVQGESLQARLRRGPLAIHEAIRVALQLAQALSYVHGCGLLHRDLKPDNVLLRGDDALLTDFGLVLDEQSSVSRITATGVFQGTPGYWAPEQARGETRRVGAATDLYGLGAVLYACLTGGPPVEGDSLQEYLQTARFRRTVFPHRLRPEVPTWLSSLCMHCLDPHPESRPGSADEVARALLGGEGTRSERTKSRRLLWLLPGFALLAVATWLLFPTSPRPAQSEPTHKAVAAVDSLSQLQRAVDEAWEAKRYPELIELLDGLIETGAQDAQAYLFRGLGKAGLGRHEEALEDLDVAIRLAPLDPEAHRSRGISNSKLGRYADMIGDYDWVIRLKPGDVLAWTTRGWAKQQLGRFVEAIEDYDQVLRLDPGHARSYYGRGVCRAKLEQHVEAIEDFERSIELEPDYAVAHVSLGSSKTLLARYAEAILDYDRAISLAPKRADAWLSRAIPKANLGRYAAAITDLDEALELGLPPRETAVARKLREDLKAELARQ